MATATAAAAAAVAAAATPAAVIPATDARSDPLEPPAATATTCQAATPPSLFPAAVSPPAPPGPPGPIHAPSFSSPPALLSLELPVTGNLGALEVLPSAEELRALLQRAVDMASVLAVRHPQVTNLDKMARRIRSDLEFVQRCCPPLPAAAATAAASAVEGESDAPLEAPGKSAVGAGGGDIAPPLPPSRLPPVPLTPVRVQGIINNLRGFQGELLAAQTAPGVVGVLRRFQARVVLPPPAEGPAAVAAQATAAPTATPSGVTAMPSTPAVTAAAAAVPGGAPEAQAAVAAEDLHRSFSTAAYPAATATATAVSSVANEGGIVGAIAAAIGRKRPLAGQGGGAHGAAAAAAASTAQGPKKGHGGSGGGGATVAASTPVAVSVEVDVVARGGNCWIEVKNQEVFGLESVHWSGASRHVKGLRRQVDELLAVAAAREHHRRWQPPRVVLFFPSGVHPDVRQQLEARGAHVAVGPDSLRSLPPPPPPPDVTNLDVTTMCGLVSEVSHGGAFDPEVELWAQRTVHWQDCLAAERASPLLQELAPWLVLSRRLIAAELACRQFQVLADMFAGPRERQRWRELQERLTVVHVEQELPPPPLPPPQMQTPEAAAAAPPPLHPPLAAAGGSPPAAPPASPALCPRAVVLLSGALGRDQVAVFGLGEGQRALTLTANGNAVRSAERRGVALEAVLHRPVWLTGR